MATFLTLQNTYHSVECALFHDSALTASITIDKMEATRLLVPELSKLLASANISLAALDFIAVNQGPGPFTTLRAVITTANGLAFASGIPLIGIDGLDALLQEYAHPSIPINVALLNAFNNDVYFGIQTAQGIRKGVQNISVLVQQLVELEGDMRIFGNGALLHQNALQTALGDRALFPEPMPQTCSITQIGAMGLHAWRTGGAQSKQLMPLYLKTLN